MSNIIPLRGARTRRRIGQSTAPAAHGVMPPAYQRHVVVDLEDRRRMQQNLAALAAVVVLLVLGGWLIDRLGKYSQLMMCLEAGHRSCMKLDIGDPPAR
jgi:hypothetical protein